MDFAAIIADAMAVLNVGSLAVQVVGDATPYIEKAISILNGSVTLSDADRAALQTSEAALRAQLNAPSIPADQP